MLNKFKAELFKGVSLGRHKHFPCKVHSRAFRSSLLHAARKATLLQSRAHEKQMNKVISLCLSRLNFSFFQIRIQVSLPASVIVHFVSVILRIVSVILEAPFVKL